jgi:hypothetical protein
VPPTADDAAADDDDGAVEIVNVPPGTRLHHTDADRASRSAHLHISALLALASLARSRASL